MVVWVILISWVILINNGSSRYIICSKSGNSTLNDKFTGKSRDVEFNADGTKKSTNVFTLTDTALASTQISIVSLQSFYTTDGDVLCMIYLTPTASGSGNYKLRFYVELPRLS